jgi:hypothetical protein
MVFEHSEARGVIELRRETYGASVWVNGIPIAYVDLYYCSPSEREADDSPKKDSVVLCSHSVGGDNEGMLQYIREEGGHIVSRTYNEMPRDLHIHVSRGLPRLADVCLVLHEEVPEAWRQHTHV